MILLSLLLAAGAAHATPEGDFLADLDLFKQRSLTIRTDSESYSAAGSARLSRLLQFTPKVTIAGGHEGSGLEAPPQLYPSSQQDWYWRGAVEWNLFKGGGDYFAWRAASKNEDSQKFALSAQELKTEVDGSTAIFRRLYLRDYQAAQVELLKLKEDTLRIGRDRFKAGRISLQEVVKMEVYLAQQQNVVRQSQIDVAENEAAYRAFFVDALKTNDWPFSGKEAAVPSGGAAESFQQLSLKRAADSFDLSWRSSLTKHLPSLDFNANVKNFETYGQNIKQWSAVFELSVPLWSRWETMSDNAQAYAASVKAQDDADQNAREEQLRREFLEKKVTLSRANMDEARANLDRANRLYQDMLRSFQLGRLSTNDLFIEQDRKIRTIVDYAQSRMDFHSSIMEACALRGLTAAECLK